MTSIWRRIFRRSVDKNYAKGNLNLETILQYFITGEKACEQGNYIEAAKWYRKAAEQGDANGQCKLGLFYASGQGVTQDYDEAAKWFRKAAEQGNAIAQSALGVLYTVGRGVTQDYNKAVKWIRKAAEQGLAEAQWQLGRCYASGNGVPLSPQETLRWWGKAAEQGHQEACKHFSILNSLRLDNIRKSAKDNGFNLDGIKLPELFGDGDMGTDEDSMPEGYGEFGLEKTSPIPTGSITGSSLYLNRLRTLDGQEITGERIGPTRSENIPSIIDSYRIYANGKEITRLYICPYNKKNSEKAPQGFVLV